MIVSDCFFFMINFIYIIMEYIGNKKELSNGVVYRNSIFYNRLVP